MIIRYEFRNDVQVIECTPDDLTTEELALYIAMCLHKNTYRGKPC